MKLNLISFTKKVKMNDRFELKENEWIQSTFISNNMIIYQGYFFQFNDWVPPDQDSPIFLRATTANTGDSAKHHH